MGVVIGETAEIGAGAVVVQDLPPGATVVGPAGRRLDRHREPGLRFQETR